MVSIFFIFRVKQPFEIIVFKCKSTSASKLKNIELLVKISLFNKKLVNTSKIFLFYQYI